MGLVYIGIIIIIAAIVVFRLFSFGLFMKLIFGSMSSACIAGGLCYLLDWTSFKYGAIIGFILGLVSTVYNIVSNTVPYSDFNDYHGSDGGGSSSETSDVDYSERRREREYIREREYNDREYSDYSYDSNNYADREEQSNFSQRRGTTSVCCRLCCHYKDSGGLCEYHSEYTSPYMRCDNFRD